MIKKKPIVIIAGEPNSIFLEIFFKSLKQIKSKNPILLVVSKKLLLQQMKILNYKYDFNFFESSNFDFKKLKNTKIM